MSAAAIRPVILSGGAGSRLWPLSRPERPKQFLPLLGPETMLESTLRRVADAARFAPPMLVASAAHRELVAEQLESSGIAAAAVVLEPCGRNTAPAIALAALLAQEDELLLVMPSDHAIADPGSFRAAIEVAAATAAEGWIVTFGIAAERPETGYGYIRRGTAIGGGAYRVDRFVEKPDAETAAKLCAGGDHDWNGGIFLFRAGTMIDALRAHAPDVLDAAQASLQTRSADAIWIYPGEDAFAAGPSVSIDYAVMEKAERVAVVPVRMGWSDVGSWDALYDILAKNAQGNAVAGTVAAADSGGCLLLGGGETRIVAVGVEDLIVVATAGEVLVIPRGRSQEVKEAVARLAQP